jgi:cephalosporin hydroxylase
MSYPFSNRIHLYKGSSTDPDIVAKVNSHIHSARSVMVLLDSSHTHEHVLNELKIYGPMVTKGQYLVVCDVYVDDVPLQTHRPRPWGPTNNPATAMRAYLETTDRFAIEPYVNRKLLASYTGGGYLRCVK